MSDMAVGNNKVSVASCIDHANRARVQADCYAKPDKYTVKYYLRHLQDCYDCPTLGFLAKREYYNSGGITYPSNFVRNKKLLEFEDDVIDMKMRIKKRLSILYPRTKYIREYITNNGRMSLYSVKPVEKYTKWDKFLIAGRMFLKNVIR